MTRLPIRGRDVGWRASSGTDDVFLAEHDVDLPTAAGLVARRAVEADGTPLDAWSLAVGDLDALVVALRVAALGDRLVAEGACAACGARVDVEFSLADYRAHHPPRRPRGAEPGAEPGWWRLRSGRATFRVPTVADVCAARDAPAPRRELVARCILGVEAGAVGARDVAAAERAMAVLAPTLRSDVTGACPECGAVVTLDVDVRHICLEELRFLAAGVHDDVHLIASAYHWSEAEILALPTTRRTAYAELVRASLGAPVAAAVLGG